MLSDQELEKIVENVVREISSKTKSGSSAVSSSPRSSVTDEGLIPDIGLVNLREQVLVKNPLHGEELKKIRAFTPARVAIGRAGTHYKTETMLRFRADHAVAQDAVFSDVPEEVLQKMNIETIVTLCKDRNEFITRPDLGRKFDAEQIDKMRAIVGKDAEVLIYVADGLSSKAVETNAPIMLPILIEGLKNKGLKVAPPFFVKYGRVGSMDSIGDALGINLICVLIGERPGLVTAESMSAYFAYKPTDGLPESSRTVISNIHKGGTPALEAGAHLVDVLKKSYDSKASGLDLKL